MLETTEIILPGGNIASFVEINGKRRLHSIRNPAAPPRWQKRMGKGAVWTCTDFSLTDVRYTFKQKRKDKYGDCRIEEWNKLPMVMED